MSFVMNAIFQQRAILGLNNSRTNVMNGKQNMLSQMNSNSPTFSGGQMDSFVRSDNSFAMNQATNNLQSLAYSVELDSLEKAQKKQIAEGFNYFA